MAQAAFTHIRGSRSGLPLPFLSCHPDRCCCDEVGVEEKRIVRSLLARMPPGAKIPVHHDTGYWVRFTHRCHIAIVTDPGVHFYVGPTADRMAEVRAPSFYWV